MSGLDNLVEEVIFAMAEAVRNAAQEEEAEGRDNIAELLRATADKIDPPIEPDES